MRYIPLLISATLACCGVSRSYAAEPAVSVSVAPVVQSELADEITLVGSAIPRRSTQVSAQVAGLVVAMAVDRGSRVQAGDELFRLDDAVARFELAGAEAQLVQAEADLAEALRKLTEAERLRAEGHIPQSTVETAQTVVAIAKARRDQQIAMMGRAKTILQQHVVTAPFPGTVVGKAAELGQWIRTDSSVLTLLETDPVRIEVPVPEQVYARLKTGARAEIQFDSMPEQPVVAQVGALIPQGQLGARTFPIWLDLTNENGRIAPGMSARVRLTVGEQPKLALFVPSDALVRRADGSTLVWRVEETADTDGDLVAQAVRVRVGAANGVLSQVQGAELNAGDLVVVRGNEGLRPNQRVRLSAGFQDG